MSLAEIETGIEQLSFEERAELAAWLHGSPRRVRPVADWKDDEWDAQMKRDIASAKLDDVLREVEEDVQLIVERTFATQTAFRLRHRSKSKD